MTMMMIPTINPTFRPASRWLMKLGGSLFDHPRLGAGLRRWIAHWQAMHLDSQLLLLPGGGALADVIRAWDRCHRLGEVASHWLAIGTLRITAEFLATLLPGVPILGPNSTTTDAASSRPPIAIVDVAAWLHADEAHPDHLPHSWAVTSDAIAVRLARLLAVDHLLLAKSCPVSEANSWETHAEQGIVDPTFPTQLPHFSGTVSALNFRAWLDADAATEEQPASAIASHQ
ncbi:amino acid kinase family protein [Tuwongella immobilis]|nr:hypothetical protein [Tuwongella immobilis]